MVDSPQLSLAERSTSAPREHLGDVLKKSLSVAEETVSPAGSVERLKRKYARLVSSLILTGVMAPLFAFGEVDRTNESAWATSVVVVADAGCSVADTSANPATRTAVALILGLMAPLFRLGETLT
jgi:hypothetical protein